LSCTYAPGNQLGIGTHPHPGGLVIHLLSQISHHPVAVRLGVNFVAHLDEPGDILPGAKAGIQPEDGLDRGKVGRILLLAALEPLAEGGFQGLALSQPLLLAFIIMTFFGIMLTTFASNTAAAAVMIPIIMLRLKRRSGIRASTSR